MKKKAVEVADLKKGDDKDSTGSQMFRCPFWDCGWCCSDVIGENGCIGIEKCRIKHKSKWGGIQESTHKQRKQDD